MQIPDNKVGFADGVVGGRAVELLTESEVASVRFDEVASEHLKRKYSISYTD